MEEEERSFTSLALQYPIFLIYYLEKRLCMPPIHSDFLFACNCCIATLDETPSRFVQPPHENERPPMTPRENEYDR